MNRVSQSLAWGGIALVTLGMILAFVAVITGPSGDDVTTAQVADVTSSAPTNQGSVSPRGDTDAEPSTAGVGEVPSTGTAQPSGPTADETVGTGTLPGAGGVTDPSDPVLPELDGSPGVPGDDSEPTLTTASTGSLEQRLLATIPTVDFAVFVLRQPGWRVTALDAGGRGDAAYVTLAYENGEDYINLSQSPSGTRPSLTNSQQIGLRGLTAEIYEMKPVLLLRWDEQGTGLLFSTDLSRDRALALAGRLEPIP